MQVYLCSVVHVQKFNSFRAAVDGTPLQIPAFLGGQGHTKCCPVPSTSCHLFTCKVWSCYIQWLRRRCIYKKIHNMTLTLESRSHKMLPNTLHIIWPMHLQNLKFLRQFRRCINKKEHYLTLTLGQGQMKCCLVPSLSCDICTCEVWCCHFQQFRRFIYKKIHYLTFDLESRSYEVLPSTIFIMWPMHLQSCCVQQLRRRLIYKKKHYLTFGSRFDIGVKATQNITQYPLHHVIHASTKFEVATSNSLGEDAFTRKYIIWPWVKVTQNMPSTLYIMWPMHLQSLKLLRPTI